MKVSKSRLASALFVFLVVYIVGIALNTVLRFRNTPVDEWSWVGGVRPTSAEMRVRGPNGAKRTLVVSTASDLINKGARVLERELEFSGDVDVVPVSLTGLAPKTKYYYGHLDEAGELTWNGSFSTPAPDGERMNFKVAAAGCALTGSSASIFSDIAAHEPFMMLHAGDLHYADIADAGTLDERVNVMGRVLGSSSTRSLYANTAMAYMWDDHDFCGNNRNADCPGSVDARKSYQKAFPHYPLAGIAALNTSAPADGLYDVAPYQSFTIGTVRFVLTDLRSEAVESTEDSPGSIMSEAQREFLYDELRNSDQFDFVVWLSSKPWVGPEEIGGDNWQGWTTDRRALSDVIAEYVGKRKQNLFVVSSDAHMVAFDDGSNTDYSTNKSAPAGFPLLQSGPLHNIGSIKGGPFSEGCFTYTGQMNHQFSILEFAEESGTGTPCISVRSYRRLPDGTSFLIFERRMCGEIMKSGDADNSPVGTCSAGLFAPVSVVLFSLWVPAVAGIIFAGMRVLHSRREALLTGALVTGFLALCFGAGVGVPLIIYTLRRVFHIDPFAIGVSGLVMCSCVYIYLIFVFRSRQDSVELVGGRSSSKSV